MSLRPAPILQAPFFYPSGNTPAVCLTQSLPPEQDAALLLLGCGDIRNILFTSYSGGAGDRKLDFTCCDLEAEIIARNIIALTLILDDTEGVRTAQLWNIYYHVFIDAEAYSLIQAQAKKLLTHSGTIAQWEQSSYAAVIRFCDDTTLQNVAKLWEFCAVERSQAAEFMKTQAELTESWKVAKRFQTSRLAGTGLILDGLRSAAPLLEQGMSDVSSKYRSYWQSGTCLEDKKMIQKMTVANPMFACHRGGLILHYGINPIIGFHLSSAYARLSNDSPMATPEASVSSYSKTPKLLQASREQLRAWCSAFRGAVDRITIRYVHAEAIAFCHVLQHRLAHGDTNGSYWYRSPWSYTSLHLDSPDYVKGGVAPTAFNVIDTSNLLDHLGTLNILTACAPLLLRLPTSTLRTEMLVPREADIADSMKKLLSGDLPTIALLLGLKSVQYWFNSSATWQPSKALLQAMPHGDQIGGALSRPVVLWKPVDTSAVHYDSFELAQVVFDLYLNMFQDESWVNRLRHIGLQDPALMQKKMMAHELYSRASLAAVLKSIMNSDVVEWETFIKMLVKYHIMNDTSLNMAPHHFQSMFTHLDMLSLVRPGGMFDGWDPRTFLHDLKGPFMTWSNIPSVVCVTLVVPRKTVALFGDITKCNGTPLCEMQVQSSLSPKQANYPDIQVGIGTVTTTGRAFTNGFEVSVCEDPEGWKDSRSLVVSAMISTCTLVEYGDTAARVVFQLKNSPANTAAFSSNYGMFLQVYGSAVGQKDVFVSRYRPNMQGHVSVGAASTSKPITGGDVDVTIKPLLNKTNNEVATLQIRYEVLSEKAKSALQKGGIVKFHATDPFSLVLTIGDTVRKSLKLPVPLNTDDGKVQIARKSLWIEYTAPIATLQALASRPDTVFDVQPNTASLPILEQLHYVQPAILPKLHVGGKNPHASWLMAHASITATMSQSEMMQYNGVQANNSLALPGRLGIKESLHHMYAHLFGLVGRPKARIFVPKFKNMNIAMIVVDSVRLDVANQSVLMDAAVLSLHFGPETKQAWTNFHPEKEDAVSMTVHEDEHRVWKHLLPAFAERCREWEHKSTCEYEVKGQIPLSEKEDEKFMCTCGLGVFPVGFLKDLKSFKELSKHAVRVAIPVIFASPISPDTGRALLTTSTPSKSRPSPASKIPKKENVLPRLEDLDAKKDTCFWCGSKEAKGGATVLLKCSGCHFAQYCSRECQVMDWKQGHKQMCKQVKVSQE